MVQDYYKFVVSPENIKGDLSVVNYKWAYPGEYPDVQDQFTLRWNDPEYGIVWPTQTPILSERDK